MKTVKTKLTLLCLFIGLLSNAQSFTDGIYTTTFGNITWTTEVGTDYPDGGMVYGDYKDKGTITGIFDSNGKEVKGSFHNGAAEGKFIFMKPYGADNFFSQNIKSFSGNWGYSSDNKYSQNPDYEWKVTGKVSSKEAIKNVTNVWSGKWNTTDGAMYLKQVGTKITGTYKGVGTVEATYNTSTRLLKGTFRNNNFNKTGYLEFYFEGNTFKGKWGWTAAMTEGNWDGTKHVKNNKELSKAVTSTTSQNNSTSQKEKYRIAVSEIYVNASNLPVVAASQYWWFYGFAGIKVYRVTNSGREEIKSFGNKSQYFFERTENNVFNNNSKTPFTFSETPEYYREFEINKSDLNNPNVKIEVELWHHIKIKVAGPNKDYGKIRETLTLDRLIQLQNFYICERCGDGVIKNGNGLNLKYKIKKI